MRSVTVTDIIDGVFYLIQDQKFESVNNNNSKKFETTHEKINSVKVYLETKIDAAMALEEKLLQAKQEVAQVTDVMLRTKTDISQQVADVKLDMAKYEEVHKNHERHMDNVLSDSRYWMQTYSKAYKENDKKISDMQSEFNGRIETIFYQLTRRVTNDDLQKNMKKLNEMLFIKFKQLEDTKQAVRDALTYQKHFYPLQMQGLIGEHMMQLSSANNDQGYMQFA